MTIFNSILHIVLEKKIFEISANQRLLWPLAAIFDNKSEQKVQQLIRTVSWIFLQCMVPIHPVVLEKKLVLHISHRLAMLNYVPRWRPSWIFNRFKNEQHLVSSLQWSFMIIFHSILHVVSEKKIFKILPIRGFYCPWQPCWITNRNESNNTWLDHANEHSCHVWSHLFQWFSRRRLKCLRTDAKWWQ